jgi:hypothetical protein
MRAPSRGSWPAPGAADADLVRSDAAQSSPKIDHVQDLAYLATKHARRCVRLRRRLADAILRGDDLAASRLRKALDRALNGRDAAAPLPPRRSGWRWLPMTWGEVEHWIESHAAWVECWKRHELSRDLPLSPQWPEAVCTFSLPRSALAFRPRGDERIGVIRVGGWHAYYPGWSFCRNAAQFENVLWAGWHR